MRTPKMGKFPEEIWIRLKKSYESGLFDSLDALHKFYSEQLKVCPGIDSIKQRCAKEKWEKGKDKEEIEQLEKETNEQIFTRLGMSRERAIKLVIDGMTFGDDMKPQILDTLKEQGVSREVVTQLERLVGSARTRLDYIQEYNRMVGALAPAKKEIGGPGGKPLFQGNEKLTGEELDRRIMERVSALSDVTKEG